MARVDVTVRGAGIFGLACAWEMARRGAKLRVIDREGVFAGCSGGLVGALAPHVPERWNAKKDFQFESLVMAESFWGDIAAASRLDPGYGRTGRLQPILDDEGLERARARGEEAKALWKGKADWQVVRAETFGDWAPATPTGWVIHDTLTARLHPRRAGAALAAAVEALGGELVIGEGEDEGKVLWATGAAGLADLSADLGRTVGVPIKGQAALLKLDRPEAPQYLADATHGVPHVNGTLAIGSTTEREFGDPIATDGQIDAVVARAKAACPALAEAPVIARWAGLRPRSRSRAPMLGRWPGRDGNYVANGGFKIGFGMAPKVAHVMADLILDGSETGIPEGFRVEDNL
ncbi:FAD-binding oxidoreductase [Tropicimonas sp. IMCC6043]|uniref:NAD(P)/FAD-dependent oxidoreductase n=1 Tax=Tropicimonas sp. IMCC6043 TaxID=2510645 RepID=UPI00101C01AC|nr:FAD-binding oxidoreductase [Tropicimonas sp. IMCC6043]RYH09919.1 FAD-binding oxidoreductase [Tropicimonas sp. IMCC6043]